MPGADGLAQGPGRSDSLRSALRLLAGLAAFILFGWGAGEIWTHAVGSGEVGLMRDISAQRSHAAVEIARVVTWAGSSFVLVPLASVCSALLLSRGLRVQALGVALSLGGAMMISAAVKILVARPRPPVVHLQAVTGFSFPSGHSTQAGAFWLSLALALSAADSVASRRSALLAGALAITVLVALSRVLLGVHYPSDVIAGVLLGGGWAAWVSRYALRPRVGLPTCSNVRGCAAAAFAARWRSCSAHSRFAFVWRR